MIVKSGGFDLCQRPEKKVVEGLCLSYDLLRGLCMETEEPCIILVDRAEKEEEINPEE